MVVGMTREYRRRGEAVEALRQHGQTPGYGS